MKRKTKIIICDSGINKAFDNVTAIDVGYGETDEHGHGSVLSEIIMKYGNSPQLTSIKILNENCECNIEMLYNALEKCSLIESDIICLPLALDTYSAQPEMHNIIKELFNQGKFIVSALFNRRNYSIPAVYPEVFGVSISNASTSGGRFYFGDEDIQVKIPSEPVIAEYAENNFTILGGNSLACGLFTAHLSTIISTIGSISFSEIETFLSNQTCDDIRGLSSDYTPLKTCNKIDTDAIIKIMNGFSLENNDIPLINQFTSKHSMVEFVAALQKQFGNINRKTLMRLSDLNSVYSLQNYLCIQE